MSLYIIKTDSKPEDIPPPCFYSQMCFDPMTNSLITFGGTDHEQSYSQLYIYSFKTNKWQNNHTLNNIKKPSGRSKHLMFLHPIRRILTIFGGLQDGIITNDMYQLNVNNLIWDRIETVGLYPCTRFGASGTYFIDKQCWYMMGGQGDNDSISGSKKLDDLWTYDMQTNVWNEIAVQKNKKQPSGPVFKMVGVESKQILIAIGSNIGDIRVLHLDQSTLQWLQFKGDGIYPEIIQGFSLNLMNDQQLLIFGGVTQNILVNHIYMIDINYDRMEFNIYFHPYYDHDKAKVQGHSSVVISNKLIIYGGCIERTIIKQFATNHLMAISIINGFTLEEFKSKKKLFKLQEEDDEEEEEEEEEEDDEEEEDEDGDAILDESINNSENIQMDDNEDGDLLMQTKKNKKKKVVVEIPIYRMKHQLVYIEQEMQLVLIGGNCLNVSLPDVWVYDMKKNNWQQIKLRINNYNGVEFHQCTYHKETGKIYLFGGINNNNDKGFRVGVLDIKNKTLKVIKKKEGPQERVGAKLVKFGDDVIYLVGGFVCNLGYLMDVWRLNISSEKWNQVEMHSVRKISPIGRVGHSVTLRKQTGFMIGGMRNLIILNDIWSLHFQQKIWEPLRIFNENVTPLYGHMSIHITDGPCEGNIIILGGLTQQSDKIEQLENIVIEKLANLSLYMLDFHSFKEINDKDKEQVGVDYLVEFKQIKIIGNMEPKCFAEVVGVNDYYYILGGGRSYYFTRLGQTHNDGQKLMVYQKGFYSIISDNEFTQLQQQVEQDYKASLVQKSTLQQAKDIFTNLLGVDNKVNPEENKDNKQLVKQQDDLKSKKNQSIRSGKMNELLSKSGNKSTITKQSSSKKSITPVKVIDDYTKNQIDEIEEQLEELQNNDNQIFMTNNSQEENDRKLNKNKTMMQYWDNAKSQVKHEQSKK